MVGTERIAAEPGQPVEELGLAGRRVHGAAVALLQLADSPRHRGAPAQQIDDLDVEGVDFLPERLQGLTAAFKV